MDLGRWGQEWPPLLPESHNRYRVFNPNRYIEKTTRESWKYVFSQSLMLSFVWPFVWHSIMCNFCLFFTLLLIWGIGVVYLIDKFAENNQSMTCISSKWIDHEATEISALPRTFHTAIPALDHKICKRVDKKAHFWLQWKESLQIPSLIPKLWMLTEPKLWVVCVCFSRNSWKSPRSEN